MEPFIKICSIEIHTFQGYRSRCLIPSTSFHLHEARQLYSSPYISYKIPVSEQYLGFGLCSHHPSLPAFAEILFKITETRTKKYYEYALVTTSATMDRIKYKAFITCSNKIHGPSSPVNWPIF